MTTSFEALDQGANDYITKPVDFSVAMARIRTQLTARRADPLTGLPNRVLFMDRLEQVMRRAQAAATTPSPCSSSTSIASRSSTTASAMWPATSCWSACRAGSSSRCGRAIPSRVRQRVHARANWRRRVHDSARPGPTEAEARVVAERLLSTITRPFDVQGRRGRRVDQHRHRDGRGPLSTPEDMIRDADTAMYRAKALGKARCEVFDTSMLAAAEERLLVESGLRQALERDEFELYYQPIMSLSDARLSGFEALLRWRHPSRGLLLPDQFIPTAEETGLIVPIGEWVLRRACQQMRAWDADVPDCVGLTINVNLSAKQCLHHSLVDTVATRPRRNRIGATSSEARNHRKHRARGFEDGCRCPPRPQRPWPATRA